MFMLAKAPRINPHGNHKNYFLVKLVSFAYERQNWGEVVPVAPVRRLGPQLPYSCAEKVGRDYL